MNDFPVPPDESSTAPSPGTADASGRRYWPGDETPQRAPASALVALVLAAMAGGIQLQQYVPLLAGFSWSAVWQGKSAAIAVIGGLLLLVGAVLLVWRGRAGALRIGAVLSAIPPTRLFLDGLTNGGVGAFDSPGQRFVAWAFAAVPPLIVLAASGMPALTRWRRRRRAVLADRRHRRRATPAS